jgi:hypothetical protein
MESMEQDNPNARFQMRFSVLRFQNAVSGLTPKQISFLVKYGYDMLLDLKRQTIFPLCLIEWIMHNMIPAFAIFQLGNKRINFDKDFIQQFLGIPSGIFSLLVVQCKNLLCSISISFVLFYKVCNSVLYQPVFFYFR